jgi:hypothetical protein
MAFSSEGVFTVATNLVRSFLLLSVWKNRSKEITFLSFYFCHNSALQEIVCSSAFFDSLRNDYSATIARVRFSTPCDTISATRAPFARVRFWTPDGAISKVRSHKFCINYRHLSDSTRETFFRRKLCWCKLLHCVCVLIFGEYIHWSLYPTSLYGHIPSICLPRQKIFWFFCHFKKQICNLNLLKLSGAKIASVKKELCPGGVVYLSSSPLTDLKIVGSNPARL